MMKNKVENGQLPSASADGKEKIPCFWGFSPYLTLGLKPVSVAPPCHPSAEADGNYRYFPLSTLHFQLSRHSDRSPRGTSGRSGGICCAEKSAAPCKVFGLDSGASVTGFYRVRSIKVLSACLVIGDNFVDKDITMQVEVINLA
jgi:hypothetical protein